MDKEQDGLSNLTTKENLSKYYVVGKESILSRLKGICDANIGKVLPGMLVKAIGVENSEALRVQLHSKTEDEIWYNTEWKCHRIDLIPVSKLIWKLLCSISSLQERERLANNKQLCKNVEEIVPSKSKVWYCPESNSTPETYLASVEYIGPVKELGDGYYFGLDIMDKPEICMFSPLPMKYFKTNNSTGVLTTLSNINPRKVKALEDIANFEKNFLSNDIVQSKKTDNFFMSRNKEIIEAKINSNILQKDKFQIDTDNNNKAGSEYRENLSNDFNVQNYIPKILSQLSVEEHNEKKAYKSLKSFDPLNSDNEEDETIKNVQKPINSGNLIVGSCVKVLVNDDVHYGVIRWIGSTDTSDHHKLMAAIELDDIHPVATDGTYQNIECNQRKALFTDLKNCHQYDMAASSSYYDPEPNNFESFQSSVISGRVPPIFVKDYENLQKICGKYRGIQGHHNSCYLDSTLFSMFAFTNVFDDLLFRPSTEKDCPEYEEVQRVLREEIVNPLRKNLFVQADHVMKLRRLLEKSSSISGLTTEEKDPEEFLTSLVAQTLNAEPFLKLSSGQGTYHYQLFVEKDDRLILPTVQQLLEQSFLTSNIRLQEAPSCFIIQMPRFGKSYKMYQKILPTLLLDVTDIIENTPRQCTVCGKLATYECKECYGQCGEGLESITFCKKCLDKVHCHDSRINHEPKTLTVPENTEILHDHVGVPRLYMELLAVVCIETSHYVSFVKCASGPDAPWCFFDSMADRKGEQDGYNIPEMVSCSDFSYWLSDRGAGYLTTVTDDRTIPEHAKRLLCDAYMCMYQNPKVMMYR